MGVETSFPGQAPVAPRGGRQAPSECTHPGNDISTPRTTRPSQGGCLLGVGIGPADLQQHVCDEVETCARRRCGGPLEQRPQPEIVHLAVEGQAQTTPSGIEPIHAARNLLAFEPADRALRSGILHSSLAPSLPHSFKLYPRRKPSTKGNVCLELGVTWKPINYDCFDRYGGHNCEAMFGANLELSRL